MGNGQAASIERRSTPSYSEFVEEFLFPRKPLVIASALVRWNALSHWTPEFFRERYGRLPLQVHGQPYTLGGFLPTKKDGTPLTFGELIDLVLASTENNPAPYLRNIHIEKFVPELQKDLEPVPPYFHPNWLDGPLAGPLDSRLHRGRFELYIGGTGGKFPVLHYDTWYIHTFLCQIYGTKRYTMFAPDQGPFLYPSGNRSLIPDIDNVDLNQFPLFARATPISFELQPGEILFVPAGWWHTTRILTPSITVSASRVNASNWRDFARDLATHVRRRNRPLVSTYLACLRLSQAFRGSPSTLAR
jgi:histone arginine demethylase JMJD6